MEPVLVEPETSESTLANRRKRMRALLDMTSDRSTRAKVQVTGSSRSVMSTASLDSCFMIVTHAIESKNKSSSTAVSANAPKSFNGVIKNCDPLRTDVNLIHVMSQFEIACAGQDAEQRESIRVPNGHLLHSISSFNLDSPVDITKSNGRRALIQLTGVNYSVSATNRPIPLTVEDAFTHEKSERYLRETGDPFISYGAANIKFIRWATYEDLCEFSKDTFVGPLSEVPPEIYTPELPYPDGFIREEITFVPSAQQSKSKPRSFPNAMNPWSIPTHVLLSKSYPSYKVLLQICNDTTVYDEDEFDMGLVGTGPLPVVTVVPGDSDKELVLEKRTTPPTFEPSWRNDQGKCVTATSIDFNKKLGKFGLTFMDEHCVSEFGIRSADNWKKVASQLIRGMRAIVLLSVDLNGDNTGDDTCDYILKGFSDILYLNVKHTFAWAGLKVSLAFAEKSIKEATGLKMLQSPHHSKNENIQKFVNLETRDQVGCFCINEYNGNDLSFVVPDSHYDVYCVPYSALCNLPSSKVVLDRQRYWVRNREANCQADNEAFILQERWGAQCMFFVVKKN